MKSGLILLAGCLQPLLSLPLVTMENPELLGEGSLYSPLLDTPLPFLPVLTGCSWTTKSTATGSAVDNVRAYAQTLHSCSPANANQITFRKRGLGSKREFGVGTR